MSPPDLGRAPGPVSRTGNTESSGQAIDNRKTTGRLSHGSPTLRYLAGRERVLGGWARVPFRDGEALADRLADLLGSRATAHRVLLVALDSLESPQVA